MTSDDIKNKALQKIGIKTIIDISNNTSDKEAIICNSFYPEHKNKILSKIRWNFAKKTVKLGSSGRTDLTDEKFKYSWDIPADYIYLDYISATQDLRTRVTEYDIANGVIKSDLEEIWFIYVFDIDETKFPAYFEDFFVTSFAFEICYNLTGEKDLEEIIRRKAFGSPSENWRGGLFQDSSRADGQLQKGAVIFDTPFLNARNNGI